MIHTKVPYHLTVKVISFLFVVLFIYAATSKLLEFENFTVQLAQSPLLSAYAGIVAWLVPGLEILIALLLVLPRFTKIGLYASFFLMVLFTTYIYIILNYADFVPCSCGGVLEKMTWQQHLVFNAVFILLAAGAIFLRDRKNIRKSILLTCIITIVGIAIVTLLFQLSETKMKRNNAFIRRYIPHPIEKTHTMDLKYSSYYIAGIGPTKIYLGNTTAPLKMTVLDTALAVKESHMISLDQMELPYSAVQVQVIPPYFFVGDGTVPILFKGNTNDWNATTIMQSAYHFTAMEPVGPDEIVIKSDEKESGEAVIGVLKIDESITASFNKKFLEKQIDGIFDTDGRLLYNQDLKKIIYTYHYRNQFIIADKSLKLNDRVSTIDTVSKAHLQIEEIKSRQLKKLGSNTLLINKNMATDGNLLFIEAPRIGRYEPEDMLEEASIIDVYNIQEQSYLFSFYLYRHKNHKLREFTINNGVLYALQGNYLTAYKMKEQYFKQKDTVQ